MANKTKDDDTVTATSTVDTSLRLGTLINVKAASGRVVRNNELGGFFSEADSVQVTVTLRIRKLLEDADLIRV